MTASISQAEFARRQGWAKSYVTKLKREGRLVFASDGGVDEAASRARIAATAAHTRPDVAARAAAGRAPGAGLPFTGADQAVNDAAATDPAGDPQGDTAADTAASAHESESVRLRRLREGLRREAGLIELGLLCGELLRRDDVDLEWSRLGVGLRANLEAVVERLAPLLAAAPDRAQAQALIGAEMRAERRRLTRALVSAGRGATRSSP